MTELDQVWVKHPMPLNLHDHHAAEYGQLARANLAAPRIDLLESVTVDALGLISRRGRLLRQSFGRAIDAFDHRSLRRYGKFAASHLAARTHRFDEALWVVDNLSPGYFHWMTECLPRLMVAVNQPDCPRVLLLPGSFAHDAFVRETLAVFPEVEPVYLSRWATAKIKRATVPARLAPPGFYNPGVIAELVDRFPVTSLPGLSERIHVSRAKSGRRRLVNEVAVIEILSDLGFVTLHPEDLTVAEQVACARGARMMVGAHGGGLTNMMFMTAGGAVVELRREEWEFGCFFTLAGARGLGYYYEVCGTADHRGYFHHADLIAHPESVRRTVALALSEE